MIRTLLGVYMAGLALALAACGSGDSLDPLTIPEGCNPLAADWDCLLPYPSDFFLAEDAGMQSGHRIRIADAALPQNADGLPVDPTAVHPADGFSHLPPILALFPAGVDTTNLVFHTGDVLASLAPSSPTVLLEADSGDFVLHFAETDPRADDDARRALFLRPLVRLKNATRYLVAIHDLRGPDGKPLPPPEGFRRLRDGQTDGTPALAALVEHYEAEVFPALAQAGLERSSLQLAWDFTTRTEQDATGDMLSVREQVLAFLDATPPTVTVTAATDLTDDEHYARRIEATLRVPLFLESTEPGARLVRDADGVVAQNGTADVPLLALVPRSLAEGAADDPPGRALQYGHGFFGSQAGESRSGNVPEFYDAFRLVFLGVDWWGMSNADTADIIQAIAYRQSETLVFTDRVHQAMANQIALDRAARTVLPALPEFGLGPQPLWEPDGVYFFGVSMGHILGGTYAALSPDLERVALNVGGAGFTFIMFRANPFATFLAIIEMYIPDALDQQKFAALLQTTFDRIDPITYAPHVLADPYPGSRTDRRVLMQAGVDDTQVPNLATQLHARALGLRSLQPAPRAIPGLEGAAAPWDGSALAEFDLDAEPPPLGAQPAAEDNGVHGTVRELAAVREQIDRFLRPGGLIEHTCDGVCDPE